MTKERLERRLAAILSADVVGYSRLMGSDEAGTLSSLKALRQNVVDPKIAEYRGRIFKTTGDGFLVEFPSVVDAVNCGIDIQRDIATRNAKIASEKRMDFRIGVNIGDIIDDAGDIFGDGVNIAARLESIAESGGICISKQVLEQIDGKVEFAFRELGRQNLKNIAKPVEVFGINLHADESIGARYLAGSNLRQTIRYVTAADGVRLAYATVGKGKPLVRSAHWLGHLEYDWELPIYRHFLLALAKNHRLIRYDARGNGLSDWGVGNISLDAWVSDMEAVVDAAGLDRFPLLGFSQGCAVSIAYAVKNPDRVSHLILYGGFAVGQNRRPNLTKEDHERFEAMKTLMKIGWGADDPTFRQLFTSSLIPTATREQAQAFNEFQRLSGSAEGAVRYLETVSEFDIRSLLPRVTAPTLVLHFRDDRRVPIALGRELAAGIPGARFVALPGENHIPLENDPGVPQFMEEVDEFLNS